MRGLIGIGAPYVQNGGTADLGVGIDMYNEVTRGPGVIENISVEGFNMGLLAPRQDSWRMNNVQLRNTTDMLITEARQAPRTLEMNNVSFGTLDGTAVADQSGQRQNIVMTADFDADAHQPFFFLMSDRITFDGQQIYFEQQADHFVPLESQITHEAVRVPEEMIGQTNQQLMDRYGTSFGGAITPADATNVEFVVGGTVGSVAEPAATSPPLYDVASEGAGGILIDPGTLTNFTGPVQGTDGDGDDDGSDSDGEVNGESADLQELVDQLRSLTEEEIATQIATLEVDDPEATQEIEDFVNEINDLSDEEIAELEDDERTTIVEFLSEFLGEDVGESTDLQELVDQLRSLSEKELATRIDALEIDDPEEFGEVEDFVGEIVELPDEEFVDMEQDEREEIVDFLLDLLHHDDSDNEQDEDFDDDDGEDGDLEDEEDGDDTAGVGETLEEPTEFHAFLVSGGSAVGSFVVEVIDEALLNLEVRVEGGTPLAQLDLRIGGTNVGDIELNDSGDGEATIEVDLTDHLQVALTPGTTVTAGRILEGHLVELDESGDVDGDQLLSDQDVDAIFGSVATGSIDPLQDAKEDGEDDDQAEGDFLDAVVEATAGDANLDGSFDSSDLIQLFAFGRYESGVQGNTTWASGDFNGDGVFDSSDLILALTKGDYRS